MDLIKKSGNNYVTAFKLLSILNIIVGVVMAIREFSSAYTATQPLISLGLSFSVIATVAYTFLSFLSIPALLILSGFFGYFKKFTVAIVLASIVFAFSLVSNSRNVVTMLSTATELKLIISELIPMLATTAMPIIFVIYAFLSKKHPQE